MTNHSERRPKTGSMSPVLAVAALLVLHATTSGAQTVPATDVSAAAAAPCIAIVLPTVQGIDGNTDAVSKGVRELLTSYLTGPSLKAVPLEARLDSQAVQEARQKGCDNILTASVTRKHNSGMFGKVMGHAAGTAAWYIPGAASTAGSVARGAVIAGAEAVSTVASSTKAKDEMRLDYRFSTLDQAAKAAPVTLKAKASSDGEDILTPLVRQAAEAVAAAVGKQ